MKVQILRLLTKITEADSVTIKHELASRGLPLDIHALRMALMRYHKQGILRRERSGVRFLYGITEKGRQRLRWLDSQIGE